jgi:hypothetical protein
MKDVAIKGFPDVLLMICCSIIGGEKHKGHRLAMWMFGAGRGGAIAKNARRQSDPEIGAIERQMT